MQTSNAHPFAYPYPYKYSCTYTCAYAYIDRLLKILSLTQYNTAHTSMCIDRKMYNRIYLRQCIYLLIFKHARICLYIFQHTGI